jgi:hypothetical protein
MSKSKATFLIFLSGLAAVIPHGAAWLARLLALALVGVALALVIRWSKKKILVTEFETSQGEE